MRGLYLVAVFMAVLLATAFAGSVEHRSLRAVEDDTTEERGIRGILRNKLQHIDAKLKTKMDRFNVKLKEYVDVYKALKDGENHDDILAGMGAKVTYTHRNGNKFYSDKDPKWLRFNKVLRLYKIMNPL